jgi:hypothetical protein
LLAFRHRLGVALFHRGTHGVGSGLGCRGLGQAPEQLQARLPRVPIGRLVRVLLGSWAIAWSQVRGVIVAADASMSSLCLSIIESLLIQLSWLWFGT